jgi:haloalkane dehalogenase
MSLNLEPFRHLYPFESRWLDLDGLRMHYLDEGPRDAEPILCVHGNPTWSFHFRELIRELRTTHRVIAPDHIGMGLSDKPDDARYPYTLRRRVEDLETLLDRLELNEYVTFVTHDWGGMIGAACALRRLDRVKRVVFLNTAGFLMPAGQKFPWQLWLIRNLGPLATLLVRGFNAFSIGAAHLATAKGLPRDVRAAYRAPYHSWRTRIATLRFVQDIPLKPHDSSYELAEWVDDNLERLRTLPVLIGWGERDFVFTPRFLAEWRRRLPDAEVHRFPDAGHYVLDDAAKQLIPAIHGFIERAPLPSDRPANVEVAT